MSQQVVFQLLYELGGRASSSEIIRYGRAKYPDYSLWQYIGTRLKQLRKFGFIDYDTKTGKYFIIEQPEAAELLKQQVVK